MIDEKKLKEEIESLTVFITGLRAGKGVLSDYAKHYKESVLRIIDEQPQVANDTNVGSRREWYQRGYQDGLNADKWIPCEVELPPQPKENPLYENKPLQVYLVSVKNCEEPFRAFWNGKDFTDGWSKLNVEAWTNLPQPYKKEGAE